MPEHRFQATRGLYLRHRTWWLRFYPAPGAAQSRVCLHTHDEKEAIEKAAKVREQAGVEIREQMQACDTEVDLYLAHLKRDGLSTQTISSRGYILRPFVLAMNVATPSLITRDKLQSWFNGRWEDYPSTAVAYLNVVSWWFDWMKSRGKIAVNHAEGIVVPQKLPMVRRRRFLKPTEARKVIDDCKSDRLKFALYCALQAGMRKLEVIEGPPKWFDIENGLIHIEETSTFKPKDRDNRTVPMTEEFRDWLRDVYGLRSPFMLEPTVKHGKYRYRYDFRAEFEAHMEACGLADVTFHDLRRTFASLLVSGGVSIYKVAKWLGDTVEQTEDTYGHLLPQDDDINPSWAKKKGKPKKKTRSRSEGRRPRTRVKLRAKASGSRR